MERLDNNLERKSGSKSTRMAKWLQFSQDHPKHAFSKKVQRGQQEKFFKNRPKRSPRLKGLKTLAQIALSSGKYALKVKRLDKIWGKKAAPKVPEWPSYGNFFKVTRNRHFVKKFKGETKGNFSKIAQKVALV